MIQTKPLREAMPTVAAFIDDLRAGFGADSIDAAIRNGLRAGTGFYAAENGHTVGALESPGRSVTAEQMVLRKGAGDV